MVSTNEPAVDGDEVQADDKTATKTQKPRKPRKPKFKDWIRVLKSTGNSCINEEIILRINEATGVVELMTNAPKSEGSKEPEGQRVQVFKITGFQVINEPDADPLGEAEAAEAAADASSEPANGDAAAAPEGDEQTATA